MPDKRIINDIHPWPAGTTLIAGSSILSGINESRLKRYKAKVRVFPGSLVDDMYDYLMPLLRKKPTNVIVHVGSNDAPFKTAEDIFIEIKKLKIFIEKTLPNVNVYLSCPTIRSDNVRANSILRQLDERLKCLSNVIKNDNVDTMCLGKKGLHLNAKGSGRLAMNYISLMQCL